MSVACVVPMVVSADVFQWAPDDTPLKDGNWAKVESWKTEDGSAVATRLPSFGDTALFPTNMLPGVLYEASWTISETGLGVSKVVGGNRFQILLSNVRSSGNTAAERRLKIEDPNDFLGTWRTDIPRLELLFENDQTFTPRLNALTTQARPRVNVTNAEGRVKIGLLQARNDKKACQENDVATSIVRFGGMIDKLGPGTLEIEEAAGQDEAAIVYQGTLSLDGRAKPTTDDVESILKRAWLRLDATKAETLLTREGDDGRLYVTNWADANGSGRAARSLAKPANRHDPFVSPVTSTTGRTLVDFGACDASNVEKLGPQHCSLEFDECTNVRELFILRWRTDPTMTYSSIIGHSTQYPLHTGGNKNLFDNNSYPEVKFGDVRVNGVKGFWGTHPCDAHSCGFSSLFLLNVAPTNAISLNLLGSERNIIDRMGGCRIGEVLVFTERLTDAERAQVNEYLMAKWFKTYVPCDLGSAMMKPGTVLDVPDGRTARIHRLTLQGDTLVKTGGGTLVVDELVPVNAKLDVRGGDVRVNTADGGFATTDAPAPQPFVWLDATAANTMTFSNSEDLTTAYLTNWTDKAGGSVAATIPWKHSKFVNHFPTVKQDVPSAGLAVVDFGDNSATASGTGSWMWLTQRGNVAYEGFMVVRATKKVWGNLWGTADNSFIRNAYSDGNLLLSSSYSSATAAAAHWMLDGEMEDPFGLKTSFKLNGAFNVVSFSSAGKLAPDLLAKDRLETPADQGLGSQQIGEFILYDRRLTDAERRNTEAYLMKKWLGKDHPATEASRTDPKAYVFADGVDRTFVTDRDLTVTNVTGGTSHFVKGGAGKVTLTQTQATRDGTDGECSYEVAGGELVLSYDYPVPALFRFDAMADTFSDTYEEGGKTYFKTWSDADGRGVTATRPASNAKVVADASLLEETFPDGVARRVASFGNTSTTAAGLYMSKSFAKVREAFAVERDTSASCAQCLLSARNAHNYLRAWSPSRGLIQNYSATTTSYAYNGYIAVDGAVQLPSYVPNAAFHLFNFAPTNATTIDTIAVDRNVTGGGLVIGEQVAYGEKLTDARRAAVTAALRAKWFGVGSAPAWTNAVGAVALEGGTLTFAQTDGVVADTVYAVESLSGSGTLNVDAPVVTGTLSVEGDGIAVDGDLRLADGATWRIGFSEAGEPACLTVSGTWTAEGRLSIVPDGTGVRRFRSGTYTLLSAAAVEGSDLDAWTIDATVFGKRLTPVLHRQGDSVTLELVPQGLMLIVR